MQARNNKMRPIGKNQTMKFNKHRITFIGLFVFWVILLYRQFDLWWCSSSADRSIASQSSIISRSSCTSPPLAVDTYTTSNDQLGFECNIGTDSYSMFQSCLYNTTCLSTKSSSCICLPLPSQFIGASCQKCDPCHESIHFEYSEKHFSVRHHQLKHSLLASKRRVNRLVAYIMILIMVFITGIIILMDILKYGFNTGPVRKGCRQKKQINFSKEQNRMIIRRSIYGRTPKLETILEEYEV